MGSCNRPFPSCCLSRFRSESSCSTIEREMSFICIRIRNSFTFEWLCTRTRFETEACSNSEMGYYLSLKHLLVLIYTKLHSRSCGYHYDVIHKSIQIQFSRRPSSMISGDYIYALASGLHGLLKPMCVGAAS